MELIIVKIHRYQLFRRQDRVRPSTGTYLSFARSSGKPEDYESALLIQTIYEKTTISGAAILTSYIKPWESDRLFGF
jgi:hypothetical protein